jgi:hypothetical protein
VNPNAVFLHTRRIQLRAWNSSEPLKLFPLPPLAAVEIATAHLFGFFRSIRLREHARGLALSVKRRSHQGAPLDSGDERLQKAVQLADAELRQRTHAHTTGALGERVVSIDSDFGPVEIVLGEAMLRLTRKLVETASDEEAVSALHEADGEIDAWVKARIDVQSKPGTAVLPFGAEARMPRRFEFTE